MNDPYKIQIGGSHYKENFPFCEPMQFFIKNKTPFDAASVCKYVLRHTFKNGIEDLEKAKHIIDAMIYEHYGDNTGSVSESEKEAYRRLQAEVHPFEMACFGSYDTKKHAPRNCTVCRDKNKCIQLKNEYNINERDKTDHTLR